MCGTRWRVIARIVPSRQQNRFLTLAGDICTGGGGREYPSIGPAELLPGVSAGCSAENHGEFGSGLGQQAPEGGDAFRGHPGGEA